MSPHSGDESLHQELGQYESLSSAERKESALFHFEFYYWWKDLKTIREQLDQINCDLLQEAW